MKSVFMRLAAAAAIVSMAAPAMAEGANPAAKLSLSGKVRASTATTKTSGINPVIINIGILAALTAIVLVSVGGDGNSDSK